MTFFLIALGIFAAVCVYQTVRGGEARRDRIRRNITNIAMQKERYSYWYRELLKYIDEQPSIPQGEMPDFFISLYDKFDVPFWKIDSTREEELPKFKFALQQKEKHEIECDRWHNPDNLPGAKVFISAHWEDYGKSSSMTVSDIKSYADSFITSPETFPWWFHAYKFSESHRNEDVVDGFICRQIENIMPYVIMPSLIEEAIDSEQVTTVTKEFQRETLFVFQISAKPNSLRLITDYRYELEHLVYLLAYRDLSNAGFIPSPTWTPSLYDESKETAHKNIQDNENKHPWR